MNEQIGKAIVGNMLRRAREENGYAQRDIAVSLGLVNPNYLSMIEKGTHAIPIKRLWDFVTSYRLSKIHGLAAVKLVNNDVWSTVMMALSAAGMSDAKIKDLQLKVDGVIELEAGVAGLQLLEN